MDDIEVGDLVRLNSIGLPIPKGTLGIVKSINTHTMHSSVIYAYTTYDVEWLDADIEIDDNRVVWETLTNFLTVVDKYDV